MPVPAGPRRAAPPRKKSSKNAPTAALPEPPAEEGKGVIVQSPPIADEPPTGADSVAHGAPLTTRDSQEIDEAAEIVEVTNGDHSTTTVSARRLSTSIEALQESGRQEVELVVGAGGHVEEAADNPQVSSERPREVVEAEEEGEDARRHRVAAKLAQMGAFNPFAGPPPIPQPKRPSIDELAPPRSEEPLDVEDEVNVDTEEYGETSPPPPAVPARRSTVQSIEHDAAEAHLETYQAGGKLDEDAQVHRDGES